MIHVIGRPPITGVECGQFTATFKLSPRAGVFMVQLIVVDFFDYALLGVVIVAIALAILIIRINKQ